jgi:hypothetical protein
MRLSSLLTHILGLCFIQFDVGFTAYVAFTPTQLEGYQYLLCEVTCTVTDVSMSQTKQPHVNIHRHKNQV